MISSNATLRPIPSFVLFAFGLLVQCFYSILTEFAGTLFLLEDMESVMWVKPNFIKILDCSVLLESDYGGEVLCTHGGNSLNSQWISSIGTLCSKIETGSMKICRCLVMEIMFILIICYQVKKHSIVPQIKNWFSVNLQINSNTSVPTHQQLHKRWNDYDQNDKYAVKLY